jgi:hypothetical protein
LWAVRNQVETVDPVFTTIRHEAIELGDADLAVHHINVTRDSLAVQAQKSSNAALWRGRLFAKLLSDANRAAGKMNHFSDSHRGEHG